MSTYVVERAALSHNVSLLKKLCRKTPIWAVVKADGYGLGAATFATELAKLGIDRFCVTEPWEAEALRKAGLKEEKILLLRPLTNDGELAKMLELGVILTLSSKEDAQRIHRIAKAPAAVHLKIDTGMGRYGFLPSEVNDIPDLLSACPNVVVEGIFTHFNCAFSDDLRTEQEFFAFENVVKRLQWLGVSTGEAHCCNSAATLKFPSMYMDGVRVGSALLGRMPFATKLKPLGFVETQIEEIRNLPNGHTTGYGALWKAKGERKIAIVPVGWFHGFNVSCQPDRSTRRACLLGVLSEGKKFLKPKQITVQVGGKACPVVGALGSLHCAIDVTDAPCAAGHTIRMEISPMHIKGMPIVFR